MRKTIAAALAALTFAGAMASSAEARDRRHRDNNGTAIAAGIAGLAIGAAIASNGRDRDRGYYDNRRYDDRRYYRNGYNDRRYYDDRRYYGPPRYSYYEPRPQRCRSVDRWDPYYGGYVRTSRCW